MRPGPTPVWLLRPQCNKILHFLLQYVLHVSSDALTLRRLAREEKLREKRQLQQENIVAESDPGDDKLPFIETTTPLKRKRKSFKKVKVENVATSTPRHSTIHTEQPCSRTPSQVSVQPNKVETPMHKAVQKDVKPTIPSQQTIPTQQLNIATSMQQIVKVHHVNTQLPTQQVIHSNQLNNLQMPIQQVIQTHQLSSNVQTPAQQIVQTHQLSNVQTPNQQFIQIQKQQTNSFTQNVVQQQQPQSETILLRLANGQLIQVPRSMLKKVNPAPSSINRGSSNTMNDSETRTLTMPPGGPIAVRSNGPTSSSASNVPIKVSSNQALQILTHKYPDKKIVHPTNNPIVAGSKTNGNLAAGNSESNGQTFRFVKIQSPHSAPALNGSTPTTSSLPQQLLRMVPTTTAQQTFGSQPQIVSATSPFNVSRIVQQQHHTVMMSAPVPVVQPTRPSLQQFVTSNGVPIQQQSGQGPMKICIIHSPRKADGTPHPPGSATPRILVMNPPSNLQQINFNEVLKAISQQNAATATAAGTAHHES